MIKSVSKKSFLAVLWKVITVFSMEKGLKTDVTKMKEN